MCVCVCLCMCVCVCASPQRSLSWVLYGCIRVCVCGCVCGCVCVCTVACACVGMCVCSCVFLICMIVCVYVSPGVAWMRSIKSAVVNLRLPRATCHDFTVFTICLCVPALCKALATWHPHYVEPTLSKAHLSNKTCL